MAKPNAKPDDIARLRKLVDMLVETGESGDRRRFLETDIEFHSACWELSGNKYLAENLRRLMMPLFTFVVLASGRPLTAAMAREHYGLVEALESLDEPDFTERVRGLLGGLANRWVSAMGPPAP